MPIKKIEKQLDEQGVLGNLPRWGKLRKGAAKPEGKIGPDLDYFRLTLETPYEEAVRPAFERLFTDKPREFRNVYIAADSADQGFKYWYEQHAHARLLVRCDGEKIVLTFNEAEQRYDTTPHECTCNPAKPTCDEHGTMDIVIPELCMEINMWGKLTILTGSIYDIIALRSSMRVASTFATNLPNVTFWSIPFRIGRAMRTVPVTINGKRSMKPMSLLYADPEPEFNEKVFNPLLTNATRLLLAGMNPETGEMPEVVIEQSMNWDRDYVNAQTIDLFDHENHQMNAIDKMIAEGHFTDTMDDNEVIDTIRILRQQREITKQEQEARKKVSKSNAEGSNSSADNAQVEIDLEWVKDPKTVAALIAQAGKQLNGMKHGGVLNALRWAMGDYTLESVQDFVGTKGDAWAACVVMHCDYDADKIAAFIPDETNHVRQQALAMITQLDIPF